VLYATGPTLPPSGTGDIYPKLKIAVETS